MGNCKKSAIVKILNDCKKTAETEVIWEARESHSLTSFTVILVRNETFTGCVV